MERRGFHQEVPLQEEIPELKRRADDLHAQIEEIDKEMNRKKKPFQDELAIVEKKLMAYANKVLDEK